MEEQGQQHHQDPNRSHSHGAGGSSSSSEKQSSEPVRSRWTPKPEQILILESIFNSGMVNPPKDETVRIRKLLEKFGAVGDANVFYWFQNRRSRSRRRQRQIQQQQQQQQQHHQHQLGVGVVGVGVGGAIQCDQDHPGQPALSVGSSLGFGGSSSFGDSSSCSFHLPPPPTGAVGGSSSSSSSFGGEQEAMDNFFSGVPPPHHHTPQMGFQEFDHTSSLFPHVPPNFTYNSGFGGNNVSGFITVFINGIATEVPRGLIDIKTLFGEDAILVHSSGVPLPTNEFGFLIQTLQHGESYFLVPKPT
ncbi:WUSCHEL-related homeobox 11-like [Arachis duranensis]|uniref:WUSCHEL-related homeobox 11-like n=1 Tax=Arachis duranensis TaxID=130453 RepID=A0A6P5M627_ARADU|nr:WUSCHEL-related homeobox 11-like [Arachis duranensis]